MALYHYYCNQRKFHVISRTALKIHKLSVHDGINRFSCDECDCKTYEKGYVKSHIISIYERKKYSHGGCDSGKHSENV